MARRLSDQDPDEGPEFFEGVASALVIMAVVILVAAIVWFHVEAGRWTSTN